MTQIDDILYAPIYFSQGNYSRVPIYVHIIKREWLTMTSQVSGVKPGVHYAITECPDRTALSDEIRGIIKNSLGMVPPLPPAGLVRGGPLKSINRLIGTYDMAEQDILINLGINPIIGGGFLDLVIWGQKFFTRTFEIRSIIGVNNDIDPGFLELC